MTTDVLRSDSSASSDLLSRVRACDALAWHRFTALYSPWIYSLSRRAGLCEMDAADIGQEVFMVAATRIDSFRRDQPNQSMKRWLAQIARNKIGDWIRSQPNIPQAIGGQDTVIDRAAEVAIDTILEEEGDDDSWLVRRAIELIRDEMSETTWLCFRRIVLEGGSAVTVAEELNMTPKAVRQAKYRVLHRLRTEFGELIELDGKIAIPRGADSIQ